MVRYDGRGYGYFNLIEPIRYKEQELCQYCGLPLEICECFDDEIDYDNDEEYHEVYD